MVGKNAIILCSGGLDSVTCGYYVKSKLKYDKIVFLFCDYNQRVLKQEEQCLMKIVEKFKASLIKVDIKWLGNLSTSHINKNESKFPETTEDMIKDKEKEKDQIINWWVPCRNTVLLSIALAHAEGFDLKGEGKFDIFVGFDGNSVPYKDARPQYIGMMNKLIEQCTFNGNYKIYSPFIDKDKDEIIKLGKELKVPFELTYSCYIGGKDLQHCGKCSNCMYRKQAFYWAGIKDPTIYI